MPYSNVLPINPWNLVDARPGQWFRRWNGTLTQYVGARVCPSGKVAHHFCDVREGESFTDRTQRFARARWHLVYRHQGVEQLVKRAPSSVDDARLGAYARAAVA